MRLPPRECLRFLKKPDQGPAVAWLVWQAWDAVPEMVVLRDDPQKVCVSETFVVSGPAQWSTCDASDPASAGFAKLWICGRGLLRQRGRPPQRNQLEGPRKKQACFRRQRQAAKVTAAKPNITMDDGSGTRLNSWMRLLNVSATQTCPEDSTATPRGELNWPFPLPLVPNLVMNAPPLVNSCMRLLDLSATPTFPDESTATPTGPLNWPFPLPVVPNWLR